MAKDLTDEEIAALPIQVQRAREKRLGLLDDEEKWFGGAKYTLAKQQFQVVYDRFGGLALDIYEDFVVWPDQRRPSREKIGDWCKEVDEGAAQIREEVREATGRRLQAFVQGDGIATMRSAGKVVRKIANAIILELDRDEPNLERLGMLRSLSGIFQHAIAGSSFHLKELVGQKRDAPNAVQYNVGNVRIVTNRAPNSKPGRAPKYVTSTTNRPRKLQEIANPPLLAMEAEYEEVDAPG